MVNQTYYNEISTNVLFQLSNEVMNTRDLQDRLNYPYPTLRRVMLDLEKEGKIVKFDNRERNSRYAIAPDTTKPKQYIPDVSFKNKSINLTEIYKNQGIETVVASAGDSLLKAWTTIATTARRLHEGLPSDALVKHINRERIQLINSRNSLEQIVFMMNLIINNEKLWDPVHLANFPEDERWESFLPHLEELYSHYFGDGNNG